MSSELHCALPDAGRRASFRLSACAWPLALGMLCIACAGSTPPVRPAKDLSPAALYPLGQGHAWSYDVDAGDGQNVLAVMRVTRMLDDVAEVSSGGDQVLRYALRGDGIERVGEHGYLLKAPIAVAASWPSGSARSARVTATQVRVQTPAGVFDECAVVEDENTTSGQRIITTYCPGVGPALVISEMDVRGQTLRVTARLRGYTLGEDDTPAQAAR